MFRLNETVPGVGMDEAPSCRVVSNRELTTISLGVARAGYAFDEQMLTASASASYSFSPVASSPSYYNRSSLRARCAVAATTLLGAAHDQYRSSGGMADGSRKVKPICSTLRMQLVTQVYSKRTHILTTYYSNNIEDSFARDFLWQRDH